jgi:hypothetical protein
MSRLVRLQDQWRSYARLAQYPRIIIVLEACKMQDTPAEKKPYILKKSVLVEVFAN